MRWIIIILLGILLYCSLSWFASSVGLADENDTATSINILPNAGTTSSSRDNFDLDGVQTGSSNVDLTNNSTHNGFTITCETQVDNACGKAFTGELEASHDLKVSASDTLVGISGNDESGNSHTSNQQKLDGGIALNSNFSVQNCEWSGSSNQCGNSVGAVDTYKLHIKIKDSSGNVLAEMTTSRTEDAGYNSNSKKFDDNLIYHGVGANSYEWSWEGIDGSQSTSSITRGPNLLGAELTLDFPTEEYEVFTTEEIEQLNESLGTANLTESEIWTVISGIESKLEEKIYALGITENTKVEVVLEENMTVSVNTPKATNIKTMAKVQEVVKTMNETKAVETLKKEVVQEVKKEINEKKENKQTVSVSSKKEEVVQEKKETKKTVKKEVINEKEEKQEKKEPEIKTAEKKETSTKTETTEVSAIDAVMTKVDAKVKDISKNLVIKNLIKLDIMMNDQASLLEYNKVDFYVPKDIYLNQIPIFDNRKIYNNITLANYVENDIIEIKTRKLNEIDLKKKRLLLEIQELQNG